MNTVSTRQKRIKRSATNHADRPWKIALAVSFQRMLALQCREIDHIILDIVQHADILRNHGFDDISRQPAK